MVGDDGRPWVVDFSFSELSASNRAIDLDVAELVGIARPARSGRDRAVEQLQPTCWGPARSPRPSRCCSRSHCRRRRARAFATARRCWKRTQSRRGRRLGRTAERAGTDPARQGQDVADDRARRGCLLLHPAADRPGRSTASKRSRRFTGAGFRSSWCSRCSPTSPVPSASWAPSRNTCRSCRPSTCSSHRRSSTGSRPPTSAAWRPTFASCRRTASSRRPRSRRSVSTASSAASPTSCCSSCSSCGRAVRSARRSRCRRAARSCSITGRRRPASWASCS